MHCLIGAAIGLLAGASCADAQPIRVLTLDSSRTGVCGTIDYNFVFGNAFAEVRAAMESDANFGPGGKVGRDIEFVDQVPELTGAALAGCDVVLLSSAAGPALNTCERQALRDFVEQGGGVFAFLNLAAACAGPILGVVPGDVGSGPGLITDESSPAADGPFGSVTGTMVMSFHMLFADVGPAGSEFAASTGGYAATFQVGQGRAVLFNDEESFMTLQLNGCAFGQLTGKELTLFLNSVAYIAPEAGFQYTSFGPCCPADTTRDGSVDMRDVVRFLNDWTIRDALADFNCDGAANTQDVIAFLNAWGAGCG